ncbi:ATP-dependent nuclease [Metabacillus dongyingensis]|uniref:ATP-dependent nuclease n=1 Tax=Metabacillus dongyingensis TaxID=2874282 RepID=UPI001CBAB641|nr:AAA family ATPase [Metabacillus dongyingensis]UAL54467.1 ATP-binding protein [Metabacillus dongyingensis]
MVKYKRRRDMIKALDLENRIIKNGKLEGLQKLNVFIGKNNSGKSTILRLMREIDRYYIGIEFDLYAMNNWVQSVIDKERYKVPKEKLHSFDNSIDIFLSFIENAFNGFQKSIWFIKDIEDLCKLLLDTIMTHMGHNDCLNYFYEIVEELNDHKDKFFIIEEKNQAIALIPAKRNLEYMKKVGDLSSPKTSGEFILDNLFHFKTQLTTSQLYIEYIKIKEQFTEVSCGYDFDVIKDDKNILKLYFTNPTGEWLSADKCGLGLHDLLIILFFANNSHYNIILIDEVEAHLHSDMQRRLLSVLREKTAKQYFMTTHSNVFLDSNFVNRVFHVSFDDKITIADATSKSEILNDLGFSITDNLTSDLIILTEGPTDKGVIEEFLVKMGLMQRFNIKTWPLGGDIMDKVDLSVFRDSYNIIALIDSDPGSKTVRDRFMRKCNETDISVHKLERYAIENYFTVDALRAVFKGQISKQITLIDPSIKLEEQIGINSKKNNRKIASKMSLEDIKGTDFYSFLEKVEELVYSTN